MIRRRPKPLAQSPRARCTCTRCICCAALVRSVRTVRTLGERPASSACHRSCRHLSFRSMFRWDVSFHSRRSCRSCRWVVYQYYRIHLAATRSGTRCVHRLLRRPLGQAEANSCSRTVSQRNKTPLSPKTRLLFALVIWIPFLQSCSICFIVCLLLFVFLFVCLIGLFFVFLFFSVRD